MANTQRCVSVETSKAHKQCEPITLQSCSSQDPKQQFKSETYDHSTVWRNVGTGLALDVNGFANTLDNWVWVCPGSNRAKKFKPVAAADGSNQLTGKEGEALGGACWLALPRRDARVLIIHRTAARSLFKVDTPWLR